MNPILPLAQLARQDVAQPTNPAPSVYGQPTGYPPYDPQYQPPYQSYPQPQYPPHQQPQYQPYQQPQYQQGPPYGTAIPVSQPVDNLGDGCDNNGKMNFGIPDDQLITEDLDISIRHAFVRKVYGILSVQLLLTFGMALMFNLWNAAGLWLYRHPWIMFLAMGIALVSVIVLACCPGVARTHPINFILLMVISVAFGFTLGYATAAVKTSAFAIAAGITAGVAISLSLFACQTKWDFTGCGVFVFVSGIVLLIFGIVMIFIHDKIAQIVYAALGALIFSFYMVYDTQQIVGGKHRKFQYSIDDYVFAALTLYMDVINLFMFILTLVTAAQN